MDDKASIATMMRMIRQGLDNVDQGISIFDGNLKLVFANRKLSLMLDIPFSYLEPGTPFEKFIRHNAERGEYGTGDIDAMVQERVETALEFRPHSIERQRPNGTVLKVTGEPLPGGGFATVYTDITAQRHHERRLQEQLLERTEELRNSEENLRMISNEVPAGIAYLDADEIFRFANRRFARFYGLHPEDILGKTAPGVLSSNTYALSAAKFNQAKLGDSVDFDALIPNQAGEALHVRTFLRPDKVGDGSVRGFYILSINITRHKQMAEALARAEKMETVGRLSSGIAHDFNNLLTIILGNLKPLAKRVEEQELREEMIAPSLRAARKGAAMTRQLLTVARRQPLEPETVNVAETVTEVTRLAKPSLGKTVNLTIRNSAEDVHVFVDPGQLENAILNLLVNARDAMEGKGNITLRVAQLTDQQANLNNWTSPNDGPFVLIEVEDDGPGIDETLLPRIFDPFFTTRSTSGGTGLGLSTTQSFIEQSSGQIRVDNLPNKGACFSILLPLAPAVPQSEVAEREDRTDQSRFQGTLCLLVDDNDEVRKVIRRELVDMGIGVLEANAGDEGLSLLQSIDSIDFLLSDISMPGPLDGIDLGEAARNLKPDLPILLMTGQGTEVVNRATERLGCQVLRKPFNQSHLEAEISKILKQRDVAAE